jgi:hypothetical protein
VYYAGKGKVDADEEQLASENVRRLVADRKRPARAALRRVPKQLTVTLGLTAPDAAVAAAIGAKDVWQVPVEELEGKGWKRASVQSVLDDDISFDASRETGEPISELADELLAADDFKLVSAGSPQRALKALVQQMSKVGVKPLACERACLPAYAAVSTLASVARAECTRACSAPAWASSIRHELAGSGIFVKGDLQRPREILVLGFRDMGERETRRELRRELFVYENGRVTAVVSQNPYLLQVGLLTWSPDRSQVTALVRVTDEALKGRMP